MSKYIVILLASAVLVGCEKKAEVKASYPPTPAQFVAAKAEPVREYISTMGTIASSHSVSVVAQVSGQIVSIGFKQGANVKQGDVLAVIDKRPFEAALMQAEGNLRQAQAQLKIDELSVERNRKLAKDGFVDKQTFDTLLAKVEVDKGVVEAARAAVDTAKINLGWCDVKAPADGKAGLYNINSGNFVAAGSSVITTVENVENLFVDFVVPSQRLHDVMDFMAKNGGKIAVDVSYIEDDFSSRTVSAQVDVVLNKIRYESGTAVLRGSFKNTDNLFWPNQPVRVKVNLKKLENVVLVPDICVQLNAAGAFVYAATPMKDGVYSVAMKYVKKGQLFGENRAVTGLKDGEKIVKRVSQLRLQAGPFVYEAADNGAIIGADGKLLTTPQAIGAFMQNATKIADEARAQYFAKLAGKQNKQAEADNGAKEQK